MYLYTLDKFSNWRKDSEFKFKTFNNIFFENKNKIIEDLKNFQDNKDDYDKLGLNHKRSYLFYGKPGTGKSTSALAIAEKMKYDIYNINLGTIKDDECLNGVISDIIPIVTGKQV